MTARLRQTAGFTLLEVMVALALLSMALMAIADLTSNALHNHVYARELTTATLLARGKMAELEEKYEDEGFKDFDETIDGDFEEEGHPDFKWKADLVMPDVNLSPEQLIGALAGVGGKDDSGTDVMAKLMQKLGGAAGGAAGAAQAGASPMAGMIQSQLQGFGDQLKKSLRELRFTIAWKDGKEVHQFTVTTHLVVLCPKAPGGARGDQPDVCPGSAGGMPLQGAPGVPGLGGIPGMPGAPGAPARGIPFPPGFNPRGLPGIPGGFHP